MLQVRLNPEELAALEAIAKLRELPVSTVAREQILRLLAAEQQPTRQANRFLDLLDKMSQLGGAADDMRERLRTFVASDPKLFADYCLVPPERGLELFRLFNEDRATR